MKFGRIIHRVHTSEFLIASPKTEYKGKVVSGRASGVYNAYAKSNTWTINDPLATPLGSSQSAQWCFSETLINLNYR